MEKLKDAWVLRLKEEAKEAFMNGDYYYCDNEDVCDDFLTPDLSDATIIPDKDEAIAEMKGHEDYMIKNFGNDAIVNAGYTNMMKHFEFVEVEFEVEG